MNKPKCPCCFKESLMATTIYHPLDIRGEMPEVPIIKCSSCNSKFGNDEMMNKLLDNEVVLKKIFVSKESAANVSGLVGFKPAHSFHPMYPNEIGRIGDFVFLAESNQTVGGEK